MKRKLLKTEMTAFVMVLLCWISFGSFFINDIIELTGQRSYVTNLALISIIVIGSVVINIVSLILAIIAIKIDYRATFAKAAIWLGIPFDLMLIYMVYIVVKALIGVY